MQGRTYGFGVVRYLSYYLWRSQGASCTLLVIEASLLQDDSSSGPRGPMCAVSSPPTIIFTPALGYGHGQILLTPTEIALRTLHTGPFFDRMLHTLSAARLLKLDHTYHMSIDTLSYLTNVHRRFLPGQEILISEEFWHSYFWFEFGSSWSSTYEHKVQLLIIRTVIAARLEVSRRWQSIFLRLERALRSPATSSDSDRGQGCLGPGA
ncbi:hypothetical protein BD309DRAFT_616477 [Dichomitus squalens]|nr:hypothetical protein BD309DRAFT_616477 [Dichomitus squalens]